MHEDGMRNRLQGNESRRSSSATNLNDAHRDEELSTLVLSPLLIFGGHRCQSSLQALGDA